MIRWSFSTNCRKALLHTVWPLDVDDSVSHRHVDLAQGLARSWPGKTVACFYLVGRTMRCTDNRFLVFRQKLVRRPIELMPNVYAEILVRKNILTLTHDEATKRPVAFAD